MAATGLEEKYDAVKQLIAIGKERGYLLYDEVNDSLPAEVHSSEEIDDLLTTFERYGIEIYEDAASAKAARAVEVSIEAGDHDTAVKDDGHAEEGSDLDLTPGSLEKTNDPVRMYLREMGTVPLLTREGEVTIAKRIERGQLVVMKAITRSPIVIKELIAVGDDLRKGARSIKEIVQFDDEELTEEKIANKTKQTLKHIDKIAKLYELALKQAVKLGKTRQIQEAPVRAREMGRGTRRASKSRWKFAASTSTRSRKSAWSTRCAARSSGCSPWSVKRDAWSAAPMFPRETTLRRLAASCARGVRN